jgi:U8 snoRNA-decapping enzyme
MSRGKTPGSRPGTSGEEDFDYHEEENDKIPEHIAYILDGLSQEDDDVELDQAGLSLTAAIGKGTYIRETDVEILFDLVPELLSILVARALSKDNRLFHGRGDTSANMWCCLHLAQSLVDIRATYPNLGETHFHAIFDALEKLETRGDLLTPANRELPTVVVSLLSLFSPKLATRVDHFERAIPIITKFLQKTHNGIKGTCVSILESCHQYAPRALLSYTESMIDSMKGGTLVQVPALAQLYEIQPEAQHMFDPHVEWLFDMYEGRYAGIKGFSEADAASHRPAMAELFKNMVANNRAVLEPYIPRLVTGLKNPSTCKSVAQALHTMALENPASQIGIVDDVKEAIRRVPECLHDLSALLAVIGANDRVTAAEIGDFLLKIVEDKQQRLVAEKASFQEMQARGTMTRDKKASVEASINQLKLELPICLINLRIIAEKDSRAIAPLVPRLEPFLSHDMTEARENAFFLTLSGSSTVASGVIRCGREGSFGSESHIEREAVFATVWCRKNSPWEFYYEVAKAVRNLNVPLVLMQVRFDGKIGFFGGEVEEGETVENTLARELREELNVSGASPETGFEYLCSHEIASTRTRAHFFAKEVSKEQFFEIEAKAREAQHFGSEVLGTFRAPVFVQESEDDEALESKGLPNFLRSNLHHGVVEELIWLVASKDLVSRKNLQLALSGSNMDMHTLVPPE